MCTLFYILQTVMLRDVTSIPTVTAALPTPTAASGVRANACLLEVTAPLHR